MPLIAFTCTACGKEFTDLLSASADPAQVRCPECDGRTERRLTPFAVQSSGAPSAAEPPPFCGRCGENRPPCSE
jgi:putative FmdB family regulatory protein